MIIRRTIIFRYVFIRSPIPICVQDNNNRVSVCPPAKLYYYYFFFMKKYATLMFRNVYRRPTIFY